MASWSLLVLVAEIPAEMELYGGSGGGGGGGDVGQRWWYLMPRGVASGLRGLKHSP